jgi:acylphosphatase
MMGSGKTRKRFVARGAVQGVFFRDTVRREAEAAGVSGWVVNRDDGAVEGVFEGDSALVDALLAAVRDGPGRADVSDLEVVDEEPAGTEGFEVR